MATTDYRLRIPGMTPGVERMLAQASKPKLSVSVHEPRRKPAGSVNGYAEDAAVRRRRRRTSTLMNSTEAFAAKAVRSPSRETLPFNETLRGSSPVRQPGRRWTPEERKWNRPTSASVAWEASLRSSGDAEDGDGDNAPRAAGGSSLYTTAHEDESSAPWTFDGRGPDWDADASEFEYEFYDAHAGLWRPLSPRRRAKSPARKSPTAIATSVPRGSPRVYQLGTPGAPSAVVHVNEKKKKKKKKQSTKTATTTSKTRKTKKKGKKAPQKKTGKPKRGSTKRSKRRSAATTFVSESEETEEEYETETEESTGDESADEANRRTVQRYHLVRLARQLEMLEFHAARLGAGEFETALGGVASMARAELGLFVDAWEVEQ